MGDERPDWGPPPENSAAAGEGCGLCPLSFLGAAPARGVSALWAVAGRWVEATLREVDEEAAGGTLFF